MAAKEAKIIGRRGCPWCGFESAHVKQSPGKNPYHHCPECGIMTHAKNGQQARLLVANMRAEPNYTEQAAHAAQLHTKPPAAEPAAPGAATDGPQPPAAAAPIIVRGGVKMTQKPQAAAADPVPPVTKPASWASALLGGL
jgi:hypothetical protein